MKLFQQLLVAGASLGLIAPIAAQASDSVNLEELNSYSRSKKNLKSARFDSKTFINNVNENPATLEVQQNEFEAGGFSDTTTLDGKAAMAIGAVDGGHNIGSNGTQATQAAYIYQMNLNTSFTGDDNLYVRLKAGDGWDGAFDQKTATYHIEAKDTSDNFNVDKMWYTFPLGEKITATVGPLIENYYMLAATPSVYKPGALKAFKLGGNGAAFGASTSTGAGLKYVADNGFASSITVNSKKAETATGFLTKGDQNKVNIQTAYTTDNYHLSGTYSRQKGWNSWSYYSTKDLVGTATNGVAATTANSDSYALRAWWRPDETGSATPSISVGYDSMSFSGRLDNVTEGSGYFVGLNWADMFQPDDKIGFALGQPMKVTAVKTGSTFDEVEPFLWELYYSFRPNDSIEITPAIFGGTDVEDTTDDDIFGAVLTTVFKF